MAKADRTAILEAKRHLYIMLLQLRFGEMTEDDLNIGAALAQDREIQDLMERLKGIYGNHGTAKN